MALSAWPPPPTACSYLSRRPGHRPPQLASAWPPAPLHVPTTMPLLRLSSPPSTPPLSPGPARVCQFCPVPPHQQAFPESLSQVPPPVRSGSEAPTFPPNLRCFCFLWECLLSQELRLCWALLGIRSNAHQWGPVHSKCIIKAVVLHHEVLDHTPGPARGSQNVYDHHIFFNAEVTYGAPTVCRAQSTTHCSYQMRRLRLREGKGLGQGDTASENPSGAGTSLHPSSPPALQVPWSRRGGPGPGAYTSSVQGSVSFTRTWSSEPTWRSVPWIVILVPPALGPLSGSRD